MRIPQTPLVQNFAQIMWRERYCGFQDRMKFGEGMGTSLIDRMLETVQAYHILSNISFRYDRHQAPNKHYWR